MYVQRLRSKIKARKFAACLITFIMFSLLWLAPAGTAFADPFHDSEAATSLTFRVGYDGGVFTPVKVFTDSDFAGAQQQGYSFMDSLPSPVMDAATGVPLTDLLSEAGIDFSKVKKFAFWATDVSGGPYKTLTKDFLYQPRYFYPHIMEYWNPETQDFTAGDSVTDMVYKAVEDAVRVDPMMCVSDNWQRGAMAPDFGPQDRSIKYRLVIGQPAGDPAAITAPNAAKWIYQIDVTLEGTPVKGVSLDKSSAAVGVNATVQLTATVTPGSASDQSVTWSSSNTAKATVSDTGLVKGVATGYATITATTVDGALTAACEVTVGSPTTGSPGGAEATEKNAVNPAAGGTVSLGSDVSANIPAGALKGTTDLNVAIQRIDSPPEAPSGFMLLGSVFEFTVDGGKSYSFAKPVTLTFTIDPAALPAGGTPSVYYYDEVSGQWVNLGGSISGNTVTVTVDHFTKYAVFAKKADDKTVVQNPVVSNPLEAFTDIKGHWAGKTIGEMVALGAISGYDDGLFRPDNNITRAEFTTLLVKAMIKSGLITLQDGIVIPDTKGHWAQEYISSAVSYGIVSGYDDDTFGPNDLISREQMAVMAVKAFDLEPGAAESQFNDGDGISSWAREAVKSTVSNGVMAGYPDNTFQPQGNATRAEAVTTLAKALSLSPTNELNDRLSIFEPSLKYGCEFTSHPVQP